MANYLKSVQNPAWYHGRGKKAPFFEGWYYKVVNKDETERYAFIPGVFIHEDDAETHSFIQVLDGVRGKTTYHRYPIFEAAEADFDVRIGANHFTSNSFELSIDDELGSVHGALHFSNMKPWPNKGLWIGYMGPFAWIPNMECNHGVLSFQHDIEGSLVIDGREIDFTGGRGYMEKDWGSSFPDGYIWQQTNHFDQPDVSLTASIATIPNFGFTFAGFTVGLMIKDELYVWSTYNGSKVDKLVVTDTTVEWIMFNKKSEIKLISQRAEGGLLLGPERKAMAKRVDETMDASVEVEVNALDGYRRDLVFKGKGRHMAMEVVGDLSRLLKS